MPKKLAAEQQQHGQTSPLRQDALRRLSRSPHPYHRQQSELQHSSERIIASAAALRTRPSLPTSPSTDEDEKSTAARLRADGYRESTNSDSGTEADDEHFLKGLPAPRLRPHKGLRGRDNNLSSSPSPLLSPTVLDESLLRTPGFRRTTLPSIFLNDDEVLKAAQKFRARRRVEVIRRTSEAALLIVLGGIVCIDPEVRLLLKYWKGELICQLLVTSTLLVLYPVRLVWHIYATMQPKTAFPVSLPATFDPAPLLYPPTMALLVSFLVSSDNHMNLLPSIILGIASLPRHLFPSLGGLAGSNTSSWFLSCLPLFLAQRNGQLLNTIQTATSGLTSETLVLLAPLHQALCVTLHYLTTTSLLEAELQMLSVALIHLLLLATSPQAIILKALLWCGGIGVLVSCGHVLKWGVALARIPKWRFRRSGATRSRIGQASFAQRSATMGKLGAIFGMNPGSDSSGEEIQARGIHYDPPKLRLNTDSARSGGGENGSISAVDTGSNANEKTEDEASFGFRRRHTLPALNYLPSKSSMLTLSGRKKRRISANAQSFSSLTQEQATIRKWLYAGYVYLSILGIIFVAIREYVRQYALYGSEPVGWALGYLFGDIPRFRMEVSLANLQRWICLPSRDRLGSGDSILGWVERLRQLSIGEANTRLILCAYWSSIIVIGITIVMRLSAIYEVDTRRKVFHFMMVAMLLPATFVDAPFAALALSLMLAIFLMLDLFRASQLPPLSKSLAHFLTPYVDGRDLKGPVVISHIFLLIGCAIPLWLSLGSVSRTGDGFFRGWDVPTRDVSMVSGVICVGMGDAAASLIGRRYGRHKWLWGGGKSIEGSIAFATAVALALILAKGWLRIGGWATTNNDCWGLTGVKAVVAAIMASLTEAVLTGGNDNVVVPIVLWLSVKGLNI